MVVDDSTPATKPVGQTRGLQFWLIFLALCFSTSLSALELTSVSTTLPTIVKSLHGHQFAWVGSAYTFGSTAFMPMSGGLAEIFGRRPVMIACLLLFSIGAAFCGSARSMSMLIIGRTIQGIGGGGILTLADIIIADLVPLAERGPFIGIIGVVWAIASAIGPPIGGFFAERNWRWLFYMNLPVAGVAMVLVVLFLRLNTPKQPFMQKVARIDLIGNILVITSTGSTIVALTWAGARYSWSSYQVLVPLILGLLGLIVALAYEFTFAVEPIIPRKLLSNRTSLSGYLGTFFHGIAITAVIYYLPVYFQASRGDSPLRSGIALFGLAFTVAPFGILTGVSTLVFKKYRPQSYVAWVFMIVGAGFLSSLKYNSPKASPIGYQVLFGIGAGILYTSPTFAVLAPLPVSCNASALALLAFVQTFAGTYGVAIGSSILQTGLTHHLPADFKAQFPGGSDIAFSAIPLIGTLEEPMRSQVQAAFAESLSVLWRVVAGISGIGLLSVFLMKEIEMNEETDEKWDVELKRIAEVDREAPK